MDELKGLGKEHILNKPKERVESKARPDKHDDPDKRRKSKKVKKKDKDKLQLKISEPIKGGVI